VTTNKGPTGDALGKGFNIKTLWCGSVLLRFTGL
jgi:hypothetical protein